MESVRWNLPHLSCIHVFIPVYRGNKDFMNAVDTVMHERIRGPTRKDTQVLYNSLIVKHNLQPADASIVLWFLENPPDNVSFLSCLRGVLKIWIIEYGYVRKQSLSHCIFSLVAIHNVESCPWMAIRPIREKILWQSLRTGVESIDF